MSLETFFTPYESIMCLPGQKVAVLAPHADDEVFGCGGSLAALVQQGADVYVTIISDGANHGDSDAAPETRMAESVAAAQLIGYPEPQFWEYVDSQLLGDARLLLDVEEWLQSLQPDLLIAPSLWEMHRDHRAVAIVALQAMRVLSEKAQLAMYEIGVPLLPNTLVDITSNFDLKNQAMQCYKTQLSMQSYAQQIAGLNAYRTYTLSKSVEYVEAFHLLTRDEALAFDYSLTPQQHSSVLRQAEKQLLLASQNTGQLLTQLNLGQQLEQLQTNLLQTQDRLHQVQVDNSQLIHQVHLAHEQKLYQIQLDHEQSINNLVDRCMYLEQQLTEKQGLLDAVLSSQSWRVTAPLRKLSKLFHGSH